MPDQFQIPQERFGKKFGSGYRIKASVRAEEVADEGSHSQFDYLVFLRQNLSDKPTDA
jgi:hypothetical protein